MSKGKQPAESPRTVASPILRAPVANERIVAVTFSDWEGFALDRVTLDDWRYLREYVNLLVDRFEEHGAKIDADPVVGPSEVGS